MAFLTQYGLNVGTSGEKWSINRRVARVGKV